MKERQDSIAARIAGTIAGGVRRRQQEREPRALVYDERGEPRVIAPGSEVHADLVETAEVLVGIALDDGAALQPDDGGGENPAEDSAGE